LKRRSESHNDLLVGCFFFVGGRLHYQAAASGHDVRQPKIGLAPVRLPLPSAGRLVILVPLMTLELTMISGSGSWTLVKYTPESAGIDGRGADAQKLVIPDDKICNRTVSEKCWES